MKKVIFCTPSISGPTKPYLDALEASIPLIVAAGYEEAYVQEVGCPYISHARATMLRKALDVNADIIVFIDYDLSWRPQDLLDLINTEGDVVAGTYRYKKDDEVYMGCHKVNADDTPRLTKDNFAIQATRVPAGFLKITRNTVRRIMKAYPELIYGDLEHPSVDLFNHGVHDGVWYGEDMAFCRRWTDIGGELVLVPDLSLTHWKTTKEGELIPYLGNLHEFLMKQEGGKNHESLST